MHYPDPMDGFRRPGFIHAEDRGFKPAAPEHCQIQPIIPGFVNELGQQRQALRDFDPIRLTNVNIFVARKARLRAGSTSCPEATLSLAGKPGPSSTGNIEAPFGRLPRPSANADN
ncbi:hypothetical protein [Arthrobacter sp. Leaf137]|uniref:hypothetical protein n=1 Tax=Arthrobacter sp. Leaf137 TaxID=1736271 RepID=UPI0012E1FB77|nr:hypothetical protein [Arthrobacter sp. Leaf137]